MKKILTTTLTLAAMAASANAALTFDYQFNQDTTKLQLVTDQTGNGYVWNGTHKIGGANIGASGGGYNMANPDKATKQVETLGITSGIATYTIAFSSWAMDNTASADNLSFKLTGTSGTIGLSWGAVSATKTKIRSIATAGNGGFNKEFTATTGNALTFRIIADLSNGSYTAEYYNGTAWTDFTGTKGSNGITSITGATFSVGTVSGQTQWADEASADFAVVDYITLDVTAVPEPSSAALLGLGGLALILRRRKG